MFSVTKQQWAVFEQWENEHNVSSLPKLSPKRALELAEALFAYAWRVSPDYLNPLHGLPLEKLLDSEELSTLVNRRRVFERHAKRVAVNASRAS